MVCAKIGGNLTREELEFEAQRARLFFNGIRNLPFDAETPAAPWKVEVVVPESDYEEDNSFTEDNPQRIVVQRTLQGKLTDFLSESEIKKIDHNYLILKDPLSIPQIYLFPHHNLAAILVDSPYLDFVPRLAGKLKDLGYFPVMHHDDGTLNLYHEQLYFSGQDQLLSYLRNKDVHVKGFDQRGKFLLNFLMDNLRLKGDHINEIAIPSLSFGVYQIEKKGDDYRIPTEIIDRLKRKFEAPSGKMIERVEREAKKLEYDQAIGLYSNVSFRRIDEKRIFDKCHIPMIDFASDIVPESDEGREAIEKTLRGTLAGEGIVVSSGQSSHFYGFRLLHANEWKRFMESIGEKEYVDQIASEIQLKRGTSMLRITPSYHKPFQPTVYGVYDSGIQKIVPVRTPRD